MKDFKFYLIRAVSNLHPGAGDASFGLVDKLVQRDVVTELPTMFASTIKGAMRELFAANNLAGETEIFGSDNKGGANAELTQGGYHFYDAKLLALPIRSSHDLYYLATCPALIQEFLDDLKRFGHQPMGYKTLQKLAAMKVKKGTPYYFTPELDGMLYLEDLSASPAPAGEFYPTAEEIGGLDTLYGRRLALLHVEDFAERCEELPTLARNSLNNGISENLWYEEIVPRETRFYCPIAHPSGKTEQLFATIENQFRGQVQIGANATVGQGLTVWTRLSTNNIKT